MRRVLHSAQAGYQLLADRLERAVAAWALAHGLANLVPEGNAQPEPGSDIETLTRNMP